MIGRVGELAACIVAGAIIGVVAEACRADGLDQLGRRVRFVVHWPVVALRLARNPNTCAEHDRVALTGEELTAWRQVVTCLRDLAAEPEQPDELAE